MKIFISTRTYCKNCDCEFIFEGTHPLVLAIIFICFSVISIFIAIMNYCMVSTPKKNALTELTNYYTGNCLLLIFIPLAFIFFFLAAWQLNKHQAKNDQKYICPDCKQPLSKL